MPKYSRHLIFKIDPGVFRTQVEKFGPKNIIVRPIHPLNYALWSIMLNVGKMAEAYIGYVDLDLYQVKIDGYLIIPDWLLKVIASLEQQYQVVFDISLPTKKEA